MVSGRQWSVPSSSIVVSTHDLYILYSVLCIVREICKYCTFYTVLYMRSVHIILLSTQMLTFNMHTYQNVSIVLLSVCNLYAHNLYCIYAHVHSVLSVVFEIFYDVKMLYLMTFDFTMSTVILSI